ncbi:hypothetical protein F4814DRAFT_460983 [Daldinia grandis]|nr:hypothetical protein F4814DRAFT_460983 [Daldinia grandis]
MENWLGVGGGPYIPDMENCVVHITNLPITVDYTTLFSALRGTGKISRATIVGREAYVHFWSRDGVTRLQEKRSQGLFIVGANMPFVDIARTTKETARKQNLHSRVLLVNGPREIINYEYLQRFFSERFDYNVESVEATDSQEDQQTMRWSFACFNSQSRKAWTAIGEEKRRANELSDTNSPWRNVWFNYESDPCQPYRTIVPFTPGVPPVIYLRPDVGQLYREIHPYLSPSTVPDHDEDAHVEDEEETKSTSADESPCPNVSSSPGSTRDPYWPYRTTERTESLPPSTPPRLRGLIRRRRYSS